MILTALKRTHYAAGAANQNLYATIGGAGRNRLSPMHPSVHHFWHPTNAELKVSFQIALHLSAFGQSTQFVSRPQVSPSIPYTEIIIPFGFALREKRNNRNIFSQCCSMNSDPSVHWSKKEILTRGQSRSMTWRPLKCYQPLAQSVPLKTQIDVTL